MLADDTASFPMTFVLELQWRGEMQPDVLRNAIGQAVERHPLLACLVDENGEWQPLQPHAPDVEFVAGAATAIRPGDERIDLRKEAGLRCRIFHDADEGLMRFHFHHSAVDGLGACKFILDILAYYHAAIEGANDRLLRQIDPATLKTRGDERWGVLPQPVTYWQSVASHLKQAWQLLSQRPQPLLGKEKTEESEAWPVFSEITLHMFDAAETSRMRRVARQHQATLNDLLIATLFQVVQEYRTQSGVARNGWLRILIPTSLRFVSDRLVPAANIVGYAFAEKRSKDISGDIAGLLKSVASEMDIVREWKLGNLFVDNLRFAERNPWLRRFFTGSVSCFATAILTNLGDSTRGATARLPRKDGKVTGGNLVVESLTGIPPLRKNTNAAFSVADYNKQLILRSRTNVSACGEDSAQDLLDLLVQKLRENTAILEEVAGPAAADAADAEAHG